MLNIVAIEEVLYDWAFAVTALPVIHAKPNAPRPPTAYTSLHILLNTPLGTVESTHTRGSAFTVDIDYSVVEELMVSINTFYAGAYQSATKLKDSLQKVLNFEQLYAGGLGYTRASAVQDLDAEINKKWEERAQFDVFFSTRSLEEENIEEIRKIQITNKLDDDTFVVEHP